MSNHLKPSLKLDRPTWGQVSRYISTATLLACLSLSGCKTEPKSTQLSVNPIPSVTPSIPTTIVRVSGSGTAMPIVQKLAEIYTQKHPETQWQFESGTNSGGAIRGVTEGTLDLAVVNRPLSETEANATIVYHAFARDVMVFAVHRPSPVRGLSTQQIQAIYGGKVTDWQEVGGDPGTIMLLDRDPDESARKFGLIPFMEGQPIQAKTIVLDKAQEMLEALASTPNSLGYSTIGLLNANPSETIEIVRLDGKIPSAEAIEAGTYPLALTLGLIHRQDASPALQNFIDFVLGEESRQILKDSGYGKVEK